MNNVAPTVTAAGGQDAVANADKAFTLGSFADRGPDNPWQVTVNWGDGSADTVFNVDTHGALTEQSHIYTSAAVRTVTVSARDKDNATGSTQFAVNVSAAQDLDFQQYLPAMQRA